MSLYPSNMYQGKEQIQRLDATATVIRRNFSRRAFYRIRGIGRIGRIGNFVFRSAGIASSANFIFSFFLFSFILILMDEGKGSEIMTNIYHIWREIFLRCRYGFFGWVSLNTQNSTLEQLLISLHTTRLYEFEVKMSLFALFIFQLIFSFSSAGSSLETSNFVYLCGWKKNTGKNSKKTGKKTKIQKKSNKIQKKSSKNSPFSCFVAA